MFAAIRQDIQRFAGLIKPQRKRYAWGLAALFVVNFSDVIAPIFLAIAIDLTEALLTGTVAKTPAIVSTLGVESSQFSMLGAMSIFLLLHLLSNVSRYPMLMCVAVPSHQIGQQIRNTLVDKFMRLPQAFYDRSNTGDLMSRATADINAARMMLGPGVLVGVDTLFLVSLVVVVLLSLSVKLTLIALLPLPIIGYVTNRLSHLEYTRFELVQAGIASLTERIRESYAGIRIIQAYARENIYGQRFAEHSIDLYEKNLGLARIRSVFEPTLALMLGFSTSLIVIFGGLEVLQGSMTLGSFMAFLFLINYLSGPMIGFGWSVSLFQRGRASIHRLDTILNEPITIEDSPNAALAEGHGELAFRNLQFHYQPSAENNAPPPPAALRNISLRIPAGSRLGIIGAVGSGKSTLVRLMTRLYDPPPNTIFFNGRDVRLWPLQELRSQIVLAPQETFLFSDTLERNVSLGRDVSKEQIQQVCRQAQLHEEILALQDGYDTMLGERGVNLSGGQRQRLAIARAIISQPPVLILDDCLSAVDARTEEAILQNLRTIFLNRTGIIISHRVCAVQDCDHIIVLQEGEVVEAGSHAELLANDGYYASIANSQSEVES